MRWGEKVSEVMLHMVMFYASGGGGGEGVYSSHARMTIVVLPYTGASPPCQDHVGFSPTIRIFNAFTKREALSRCASSRMKGVMHPTQMMECDADGLACR